MNKDMKEELNEKGWMLLIEALACIGSAGILCGGIYAMALIEQRGL